MFDIAETAKVLGSRHAKFLEALPEAVLVVDPTTHIAYANQMASSWFGGEGRILVGLPLHDLISAEVDLPGICLPLAEVTQVKPGTPAQRFSVKLRQADGDSHPVWLSLRPFDSEAGVLWLAMIEPDRKKAEVEKRMAANGASTMISSLREVILKQAVTTTDQPIPAAATRERQLVLLVDDETAMRDILSLHLQSRFDVITARNGLEAFEMAKAHLPDLILSDIRMPVRNGFELCQDVRASEVTRDIPMVMLTATDDQAMKLDCLAAGATDFLSKPCSAAELLLRVHNLTQMHRQQQELAAQKQRLELALQELRQKDEMLVRHERLAALGRMSAGLIHEINNPLNYALQGLSLLRQTVPDLPSEKKADFVEVLQDIEEGVGRVTRIVNDLRGFATSPNRSIHQPTELAAVVETVLKHLSHVCRSGNETRVELPPGLCVRADKHQMVQVMINLVKNALDAIAAKVYAEGESPLLLITADLKDGRVCLRIRDNGIGMTPEVREHIFEPFFTTKEVGQGMGLGLSICHSILGEHGALVDVQSSPGEFTEFSLLFPAFEGHDF